ncbi:MAG: hypothetical protein WB341_14105, partial [Terracidiphilus sp.]
MITVLFFLWAIPNNLNDILIRQFMKSFNINRSSAAGVQIWFYLGYFLLAIPAAQFSGAGQKSRNSSYDWLRKTGQVTGLCVKPGRFLVLPALLLLLKDRCVVCLLGGDHVVLNRSAFLS